MYKTIRFFLSPYLGFSKTTWKIIVAGFINATGLTLTLYISLYLNSMKYSITEIGSVITLFGFGGLIGGYLGGYLADKFTALRICKASLLSNAALLALFPLSSYLSYLYVIAFLLGVSSNLFRPAFILALARGEKSGDLEKIIALRRVAINLGMAFGAAILSSIVSQGFIFLFLANALASLIAYILIKRIPDAQNITKSTGDEDDESLQRINFYFILLLMFMILLVFNQSQLIYPIYLKNEAHTSLHLLSLLFTLNGILIALFQMPVTNTLSKYNPNIACAIGTLLIGFGFAILSLFQLNTFLIILSCIFWTVGEIIFFPALLAVILRVSRNKKGKNMGIYQFVYSLALLVSPAFGTFIYDYDKNLFWHISGIIGIITCISFLLNIRHSKFVTFTLTPQKTEN